MIGVPAFLLAVSTVLSVAAVAVSLFAAWRGQALAMLGDARTRTGLEQCEESVRTLRLVVEELTARIRELPPQPADCGASGVPRHGLNLTKRSQVLRMHRKGDPPDQIAATLEVPFQEVDLLIKVHSLIVNNL